MKVDGLSLPVSLAAAILCLCSSLVTGSDPSDPEVASRVCRPGPPLLPPTDGRRNCLVIGDSVSLGYTPVVVELLNATLCQVQHAPFSNDGGALDTKYAVQCLDQWMVTSMLEETKYDAIVINSGLHDVNYSHGYPEEYTNTSLYRTNFEQLKTRLLKHTPHVALVTTTPVGYDTKVNQLVIEYNAIAQSVMSYESPILQIIDLYSAVIKVCGEPPYKCNISASANNVHYNAKGYQILGGAVADGFKKLLSIHDEGKKLERFSEQHWERNGFHPTKNGKRHLLVGNVCADGKTSCPANTTCTVDHFSSTGYGCCYAQPQPIQDCGDSWHCCPHGLNCGSCSLHGCMCLPL